MNRRDLLKTMGAVAGVFGLGKTVAAEPPSYTPPMRLDATTGRFTNRMSRHKQYEKFLQEHPDYFTDDVINPIAKEVFLDAVVRPRYVFNEARNMIELPGVDMKFVNKYFSSFKIGLIVFNCALYGDWFGEVISDPTYPYPLAWQHLPSDSMYRIETTKGKLLEYQQSKDGPDYEAMINHPIGTPVNASSSPWSIRFFPSQIVHIRVNCEKYYPYGTSCLETRKYGKSQGVFPTLGKPKLNDQFIHDVTEGVRELVGRFRL